MVFSVFGHNSKRDGRRIRSVQRHNNRLGRPGPEIRHFVRPRRRALSEYGRTSDAFPFDRSCDSVLRARARANTYPIQRRPRPSRTSTPRPRRTRTTGSLASCTPNITDASARTRMDLCTLDDDGTYLCLRCTSSLRRELSRRRVTCSRRRYLRNF